MAKRKPRSPGKTIRPVRRPPPESPPAEPDLLTDVRRALAEAQPLEFLAMVSSLLAALDPRARNPFQREPDAELPSADELAQSFLEIDRPETSALLAVIAELTGDELARTRIRRKLDAREHVLPRWLRGIADAEIDGVLQVVHVLGDGDNIVLGVRLPGGYELSFMVYIDHNLGTVVKDAVVVPEPLPQLIELMLGINTDPDTSCIELDPADARTRISDAIDIGARMFPPLESDSWPACRPLVGWAARLLPEGGTGYQRPEWDDEALHELTERFFDSPFGSEIDDPDHRGLLESLLWFGTDYGPGDPLRWSPTAVEIVLADWIPRKIVADADYLAKAPTLLRAFIRFCHHERAVRSELTDETLAAVDEYEPDYQRTIRTPRPQGPDALLAAIGALDPDDPGRPGD